MIILDQEERKGKYHVDLEMPDSDQFQKTLFLDSIGNDYEFPQIILVDHNKQERIVTKVKIKGIERYTKTKNSFIFTASCFHKSTNSKKPKGSFLLGVFDFENKKMLELTLFYPQE